MSDACLREKQCVACQGVDQPLKGDELGTLAAKISEWTVVGEHHIHREFRFPDFAEALAFANLVGQLAEEQHHHPKLTVAWGKVEVEIHTHAVNGLTENDFILAAKIDAL